MAQMLHRQSSVFSYTYPAVCAIHAISQGLSFDDLTKQ